jgi:hypothetical protein
MLDFIGTVILVAMTIVTLNAFVSALPVERRQRLLLAVIVGTWTGLAVALSASGELDDAGRRAFPLIGVMFGFPLIAAALLAALSPAARKVMLGAPLPLLIGLNTPRVFGLFFLLLEGAGRLGGPFPFSAGWGDIITGVLAVPAAMLAARGDRGRDGLLHLWNAFGTLDLFAAVALGVVSTNGSNLQLIHAGAGSAAMQHLPWSLIPTVLVPAYLIVHGIIFAQLRVRSAAGTGRAAARTA